MNSRKLILAKNAKTANSLKFIPKISRIFPLAKVSSFKVSRAANKFGEKKKKKLKNFACINFRESDFSRLKLTRIWAKFVKVSAPKAGLLPEFKD